MLFRRIIQIIVFCFFYSVPVYAQFGQIEVTFDEQLLKSNIRQFILPLRDKIKRFYSTTVWNEEFSDLKLKRKLFARQIIWNRDNESWKLKSWRLRTLNESGESILDGFELDTTLLLNPNDFDNNYRLSETFTMGELNDFIDLQKLRGADDINIYEIEKYMRYAQPFTVIILVLLGAILASKKSRQGTGFLIALGFLIAFTFIIFFMMSRAFAENDSLNPLLAVWLPNIIFGLITIYLYRLVPK